jgi:hypothetical protein
MHPAGAGGGSPARQREAAADELRLARAGLSVRASILAGATNGERTLNLVFREHACEARVRCSRFHAPINEGPFSARSVWRMSGAAAWACEATSLACRASASVTPRPRSHASAWQRTAGTLRVPKPGSARALRRVPVEVCQLINCGLGGTGVSPVQHGQDARATDRKEVHKALEASKKRSTARAIVARRAGRFPDQELGQLPGPRGGVRAARGAGSGAREAVGGTRPVNAPAG